MNLILIPIWLLSGAFFPMTGAPGPLRLVMHINPLTYGMGALRRCLYLGNPVAAGQLPPLALCLVISAGFAACAFLAAVRSASRSQG